MTRAVLILATVILSAAPATAFAAAGDLDPAFGDGGSAKVDAMGPDGMAMTPGPAGTTLVAGNIGNSVFVTRLRGDGSVDESFGEAGRWTAESPVRLNAVTTLAGGRIIGVGTTTDSSVDAFVLVLTSEGQFVTFHALGNGGSEVAHAVEPGPNGTVLVAGSTTKGTNGDAVVWRVHPDTGIDPTFDADGAAGMDTGGEDVANALAVRPDGRIVVAGRALAGMTSDAVVWRLKPDGDPANVPNSAVDRTFGDGGVRTLHRMERDSAADLALLPTGEVVVAGISSEHTTFDADGEIWRLSPEGALDTSFDGDGRMDLSGDEQLWFTAVAPQPDGALLATGSAYVDGNPKAMLWRVRPQGGLDPAFGSGGARALPSGAGRSLLLAGDRRILVASAGPASGGFVSRVFGDPYVLTVARSGKGAGTVYSTTGGIDCGLSCADEFDAGSVVRLVAAPASGMIFAGWTGESCSGTEACVVTMDADRTVQARFEPVDEPPREGVDPPRTPTFGPRTLVTLKVGQLKRGRRVTVTVRNANAFSVSGTLAVAKPRGVRRRPLRVAGNGVQRLTLRLPRSKARRLVLRATVQDPAWQTRTVRLTRSLRRGR